MWAGLCLVIRMRAMSMLSRRAFSPSVASLSRMIWRVRSKMWLVSVMPSSRTALVRAEEQKDAHHGAWYAVAGAVCGGDKEEVVGFFEPVEVSCDDVLWEIEEEGVWAESLLLLHGW